MADSLDVFYLKQPEPHRSCLLALRQIILNHHENISETRKYGMPCFVYGKKALVYLWLDKKSGFPYILFVDGDKMTHPALEQGDRKRMKVLMVDPNKDIKVELLQELLKMAEDAID